MLPDDARSTLSSTPVHVLLYADVRLNITKDIVCVVWLLSPPADAQSADVGATRDADEEMKDD